MLDIWLKKKKNTWRTKKQKNDPKLEKKKKIDHLKLTQK